MKASIVVKKVVLSFYRKPFGGRESWLFSCLNSFGGREKMWLYRNHVKLKYETLCCVIILM